MSILVNYFNSKVSLLDTAHDYSRWLETAELPASFANDEHFADEEFE